MLFAVVLRVKKKKTRSFRREEEPKGARRETKEQFYVYKTRLFWTENYLLSFEHTHKQT